jgi:hypothetical protein
MPSSSSTLSSGGQEKKMLDHMYPPYFAYGEFSGDVRITMGHLYVI